jgi:hypothetical protein
MASGQDAGAAIVAGMFTAGFSAGFISGVTIVRRLYDWRM